MKNKDAVSWEHNFITKSPDGHFLVWDETQAGLVAVCYSYEEAFEELHKYAEWLRERE